MASREADQVNRKTRGSENKKTIHTICAWILWEQDSGIPSPQRKDHNTLSALAAQSKAGELLGGNKGTSWT